MLFYGVYHTLQFNLMDQTRTSQTKVNQKRIKAHRRENANQQGTKHRADRKCTQGEPDANQWGTKANKTRTKQDPKWLGSFLVLAFGL